MHFEPFLGARFARADDIAHALDQDLGPAAVERRQPRVAQLSQAVAVGAAGTLAHVVDLGRREQRQLHVRNPRMHFGDRWDPEIETRLLGIVAAHDVQLVVIVWHRAGALDAPVPRR